MLRESNETVSMNEKQVIEEIMRIIDVIGLPTGSRVFGLNTDNSDWDYVVYIKDFERAMYKKNIPFEFNNPNEGYNHPKCIYTDKRYYNMGHYFRSYRIYNDVYSYNILMVWDRLELEVWKRTTNHILTLPLYLIKNKKNRILLFESIKKVERNILRNKEVSNEWTSD